MALHLFVPRVVVVVSSVGWLLLLLSSAVRRPRSYFVAVLLCCCAVVLLLPVASGCSWRSGVRVLRCSGVPVFRCVLLLL